MNVNSVFKSSSGGNWLTEKDLDKRSHRVTITEIEPVELEQTGDDGSTYMANKLIISFANKTKQLCCNKTNALKLADKYGEETDNWIGKELIMYPDITPFKGVPTPCIRIRFDEEIVEGEDDF